MERGDRGQRARLPVRDTGCGQVTNIGYVQIHDLLNYTECDEEMLRTLQNASLDWL